MKPSIKVPLYNGALECQFRKYQLFDGKYKAFRSGDEGKEFKPRREEARRPRRDGEKSDGKRRFEGKRGDFKKDFDGKKKFGDKKEFGDKKFEGKKGFEGKREDRKPFGERKWEARKGTDRKFDKRTDK